VNEYVHGYSATYSYGISDVANLGGIGGPEPEPDLQGHSVALQSSLRWAFCKATTTTRRRRARQASADMLQRAIWWFEGEVSNNTWGRQNDYTALALNAVTDPMGDANGAFGVRVLNLEYTTDGTPAQDQLVLVPEPDAWLLLGALLVGLVARVVPRRSS